MEVFFKKGLGSTKVSGIHYDDVKPQLRSQALDRSEIFPTHSKQQNPNVT
jgi:hypothetical protein